MDRWADSCPCSCHGGGAHAECDHDGGCGHLHGTSTIDPAAPHARRCARRGDCPGYQRVDANDPDRPGETMVIRIGAPIQSERGLCGICREVTAQTIAALEDDFWGLYAMLGAGEGAAADGDPVSGTRELPIPIRPAVRDLAARIVAVMTAWAEPVAEQAGMTWDACMIHDHTRPHAALALAVRVLRWHAERLIDHGPIEVRTWSDDGQYSTFEDHDGIAAAVELNNLHGRAQTVRGLTELRHHLPAPCPRCDTMTLYRDNGDDHVYCARCRVTYAETDYNRLTLILADDYRAA